MALTSDGEVYSWGFGRNGRLGHGSIQDFDIPTRIEAFQVSEDKKVVEVCCGDSHSLARSKDGHVFSWGSGSYGRLGLGAENDQYAPKAIESIKHAAGISWMIAPDRPLQTPIPGSKTGPAKPGLVYSFQLLQTGGDES